MEPIYVRLREYVNSRLLENILVEAAKEMGWKATIIPFRETVYHFLDGPVVRGEMRVVRDERSKYNTVFVTSTGFSRKVEFKVEINREGSGFSITNENNYNFPSDEDIRKYLSFVYEKALK